MSEVNSKEIDPIVQLGFTLDFAPLKAMSKEARTRSLKEQFEAFHQLNPHVYQNIVKMVLDDYGAGVRHMSIQFYLESLRRGSIRTTKVIGGGGWKINNSHGSFYARKIMAEYPQLQGYFEVRERRKTTK